MYSVGLFSFASKNKLLEEISRSELISVISKYSFGIYLFHPIFLNLLNKGLHIFPDILPVGIGEIVFFVAAFASSFVATWALCRIKWMREIIV